MKKENLETLFKNLEGSFDMEEPKVGHEERFLERLNNNQQTVSLHKRKTWWKPLSIAASIVLLISVGTGLFFKSTPSIDEQVAEISPEASQTEFYFVNLINEQIKQLESESTPETQKIIDDTLFQLKKLETNYEVLEQDLLKGGNSKLILSAMITNFQTRIDLLQEVLNQVERIKNLKNYDDENFTI
ncbi:putative PurR-regulated permease PerM [Saonia flava]|uniref:Putative PurR-regulated permease PerM n=1 Tax=Saonia flava TaxID=523696 RepID=A0A846QQP9_9FLAO|nr:hypothetical protein [Saonia flava]NJB70461.1 putative PurR-regulated permease PerM [Saonia flava]